MMLSEISMRSLGWMLPGRYLRRNLLDVPEMHHQRHLFCGGVNDPKEITGNAKLQEAYEMGMN